jgi:hypothetical protein
MAVLITGEVVRIMSMNESEIVVEGVGGVAVVRAGQIARTYRPCESCGHGYSPRTINDTGMEMPDEAQ